MTSKSGADLENDPWPRKVTVRFTPNFAMMHHDEGDEKILIHKKLSFVLH